MIKIIIEKIKKHKSYILASFLWLCVWATYNTDIFRLFNPGFPHNTFDLIHGIRSLFPFIALAIAIVILIKNKKFDRNLLKGPLGLLLIYSIIGIIASIFSKNLLQPFYWGGLYLSAIIILSAIATSPDAVKKVSILIRINWIIAGLIAFGLTVAFFSYPGVFSSQTFQQFLSGQRPYETIKNVTAASDFFGMPGTRPTGLGRYAGIAAIIVFTSFWISKKNQKIICSFLFFIFFSILIFSRARTSVVAFIISALIIAWSKSRSKVNFLIITITFLLLFLPTNFYQFSWAYLTQENLIENRTVAPSIVQSSVGNQCGQTGADIQQIKNQSVLTLSGRTSGVWTDAKSLFLSSPLIGRGFHADRIFLDGQHAHNSLLHALIQSGIIGTLFFAAAFLLSFIILVRLFIKYPKNIILIESIGILIFFTVRSITESFAYFGADYLFVVPIIAYAQCLNNEVLRNNKGSNNKNSVINFAGTKVNAIQIPEVLEKMSNWIKAKTQKTRWVVVTGMHGIVEASKNPEFEKNINSADLFVPDGISLVWLARFKGFKLKRRVSGADLMAEFFKVSSKEGFTNYFYGDTEETLKVLKEKLNVEFPGFKIAGTYSPPFRELTTEEDKQIIQMINQAHPDVLWVGLGLPKQENWIYKHKDELSVPVVVGVGAAFKFLSGKVKRVPKWIGNLGFEWLWRLFCEPKRIWKRVFLDGPIFFGLVIKDLFKDYE